MRKPMPPGMVAKIGRGWGPVTEANRARRQEYKRRIMVLTIMGATSTEIAEYLGLAQGTIRRTRVQLRQEGLLGCCMQPCSLAPDSDATRCKWYVH